MKAKEFKTEAEILIDKFQELINKMPIKGNTTSECQRITLQQSLSELSYSVNGVEESDFFN